MYTISVVNEKGGTGKTTTAVNLAAALGEMGHKVLLVDLDGQAASSRWLGVEEDTSFADALYTGKGLKPLPDVMPNVSLAPASGKLDAVAHDLRPTQGGQLRKLLAEVKDQFEFVIIDCPPSLGNRLIGNALIASTHAVVPVETSILALDGLKILLTTLDDVRDGFGHEIILAGVVACRFDNRTRLSRLVLAELKRSLPGRVFETVIRENVRMRECPASGQSILTYAPDSHAAEDYRLLARELLASPRLSCLPQDQADAAGTEAFFAADKDSHIGDSLRQSVRKSTRDAAAEDADNAVLKKRLEEAQQRLAAEDGMRSGGRAGDDAAVEIPDETAELGEIVAPAGRSAAELDPEAIRREVEAMAADASAIGAEEPVIGQAAAAAEPAAASVAESGMQPMKPIHHIEEPKICQAAEVPAAAETNAAPEPGGQQTIVGSYSVPPGEAASGDAAWLDLITGANTAQAKAAGPAAPAGMPVAMPEAEAPAGEISLETDWTLETEDQSSPTGEQAECPNLRRYLEELKQKKDGQDANANKNAPRKGLLGRFFARSGK